MEQIKEIDMKKYFVLKWKDIKEYGKFSDIENLIEFKNHIDDKRKFYEDKPVNDYLILNMSDLVDLDSLRNAVNKQQSFLPISACKVGDVAVDLVNAILKAKKPI